MSARVATTTRTRATASPPEPVLAADEHVADGRGPFARLVALIDRLPHFTLVDRFQREVVGVLLLFIAGLSGWALARGGQDGRVVAWWRDVLGAAYGPVGGWLVPIFLVLIAVRVFRDLDESILRPRHYLGGFLFAVAALGLLELAVHGGARHLGGNFGLGVAMVTRDALGEVAGGVALYLLGTISVFLLANMSLSRFWHEVRWLLPERRRRGDSASADFDHWPERQPDDDAVVGMATSREAIGQPVRSGRFQRRREGSADLPSGVTRGPVRSVGQIDTDLAVLAPAPDAPTMVVRTPERRTLPSPEWREADTPASSPVASPRRSPTAGYTPRAVPLVALPVDHDPDDEDDAFGLDSRGSGEDAVAPLLDDDEDAFAADDAFPETDEPFGADDDAAEGTSRADQLVAERTVAPNAGIRSATNGPSGRPNRRTAVDSVTVDDDPVIHVPPRQTLTRRGTEAAVPEQRAGAAIAPAPSRRVARGTPMPLPTIEQLPYYEAHKPNTADLEAKARLIQEKLASFRVQAWVREINTGPAVTQFALEPGEGVKVRRITELQNDLALALAAPQIRIEAPVPGMARVGIEVPNDQIMTVGLRETLESVSFRKGKQKLPIPLGLDVNGRYIVHDLARMPHLLIAGATGSGKSVCINGIISTFLLTRRPDEVKLLMIDPKMVELTGYNGVPHLQCPVVTEMGKVVPALRLVLREMERRYTLFSTLGVRNLDGYRLKTADEPGAEKLPYLVVIIDELADLMMTTPVEVESLLQRLTQMARATGIHMIIATQRPSVDVITGIIKANVPARIAFMVSSGTDSRVILDVPGAERLLGKGDMLFLPPDAAKPQRIQGVFVADEDVPKLVDHWQSVVPVPQYAQEWIDLPSVTDDNGGSGGDVDDDDPLWDQAIEIVRKQGTASASMLQRRLRVGYNRAARMIQRMEDEEIIGPADGIRGRTVLLPADDE